MPSYWKLLSQIGLWRCDWRIDMTSHIAIATSLVLTSFPSSTSGEVILCWHIEGYWPVPKYGQLWYVFFEGYSSIWMIKLVLGGVLTFNTKVRPWHNLTMFSERTVCANVNNLSWCKSQPGNDVKSWWCGNSNLWSDQSFNHISMNLYEIVAFNMKA